MSIISVQSLIALIGTAFAASYSLFSILLDFPLDLSIFLGLLSLVVICNGLFLYRLWQRRATLDLQEKTLAIFWGFTIFWFWVFAPLYYILNINLNNLQLKWVAFSFLWEVPVVGGLFIITCLMILRPLIVYERSGILLKTPEQLYRLALTFPLTVCVLDFIFTILGYGVGSIQLRQFAFSPEIEQLKSIWNGFAISFLTSVSYYIVFDVMLDDIRGKLKREHGIKEAVALRRKIGRKITGVFLMVVFGVIAINNLLNFQSSQLILEHTLVEQMRSNIRSGLRQLWVEKDQREIERILDELKTGEHGIVLLLSEKEEASEELLSDETISYIRDNSSGSTRDLKNDTKMVVFFQDPARFGSIFWGNLHQSFS